MQLEEMIQWLIGVGASTGAGCQCCLQTCIAMARQCGADEQQVDTATAIGNRVRRCAEQMAEALKKDSPASDNGPASCSRSASINDLEGRSQ